MRLLIATAAAAALGLASFAIASEAAQPSAEQCSNHLFATTHKAFCATANAPVMPPQNDGDTAGPGSGHTYI